MVQVARSMHIFVYAQEIKRRAFAFLFHTNCTLFQGDISLCAWPFERRLTDQLYAKIIWFL